MLISSHSMIKLKGKMMKVLLNIVAISAVLFSIRGTPYYVNAQSNEQDITVILDIVQLRVTNLSDDGIFDDNEDEMVMYYILTPIDAEGNILSNEFVYGNFERNFTQDETQTAIPELELSIPIGYTARTTIILVEKDEGSVNYSDFFRGLQSNSDSNIGIVSANICGIDNLDIFITALMSTSSEVGSCMEDIFDDIGGSLDDRFPDYIQYRLPTNVGVGFAEVNTHEFSWSGDLNNSSYEISYTISTR